MIHANSVQNDLRGIQISRNSLTLQVIVMINTYLKAAAAIQNQLDCHNFPAPTSSELTARAGYMNAKNPELSCLLNMSQLTSIPHCDDKIQFSHVFALPLFHM